MTVATIVAAIRRELSQWTPVDVALIVALSSPLWLFRALHLLGVC